MTISNHPENFTSQAAHDLGQISMQPQAVSATAAAAAKVAKPKKVKAVSHAKPEQTPLPLPVIDQSPEFGQLDPTQIVVLEQVRTAFDEDSLKELAGDIADRGILQPLTVRKTDAGFVLVAGERRLRAALIAGLEAVPVLICRMTEDENRAAQLAENIQRDDLSTYETAKAIKQLHDSGKTPTEIGALVHKSKSWVSKHLAAAHPNLSWQARNLLEDGSTEDLELVLAVDQLAKLDYYEANQIVPKIRNGNAGRETVREQLAIAREKDAARKAQQQAIEAERNDPEYQAKAKAEREANEARWQAQQEEQRKRMHLDPNRLMVRFWDWCAENEDAGSEFCHPARLCRDQCDSLTHAVDQWYAAGQGMNVSQLATRLLTEYVNVEVDPGYGDENRSLASWQVSAMSYAVSMSGKSASLEEFLDWYAANVVRPAQRRYS